MAKDNGLITPISAIDLAAKEAVVDPGYTFDVVDAYGQFVELRLARPLGGVPRVQSVKLSRAMSVHQFQDAARRFWAFLKLEHERVEKFERRSTNA